MSTATVSAIGSTISWFEIPSSDFDRAVKFYETIFARELVKGPFMGTPTAVFAYERPNVSGCVLKEEGHTPSTTGTLVFLNANGIFDDVLLRVPKAGGKVESVIGLPQGMGRAAHIIDTEGNRVGLHTY
jgi:predicted enzyme related to lactoylglutathione lyase